MLNLKELNRLNRLHQLIRKGSTGTPKQIASRFEISERSVHRLIEKLKEIDAPIYFDRTINSYCYKDFFQLEIEIKVRAIHNDEHINIYGGTAFKKTSLPRFGIEQYYI